MRIPYFSVRVCLLGRSTDSADGVVGQNVGIALEGWELELPQSSPPRHASEDVNALTPPAVTSSDRGVHQRDAAQRPSPSESRYRMQSKIKRWQAAGAGVAAGAVGAGSGYTAASYGVDPAAACNLGWNVALAAGRSLFPLFRNQGNGSTAAPEEPEDVSPDVQPPLQRSMPPQSYPEFFVPAPRAPRHSEHRRLQRAALRSAERIRQQNEEDGHGAA